MFCRKRQRWSASGTDQTKHPLGEIRGTPPSRFHKTLSPAPGQRLLRVHLLTPPPLGNTYSPRDFSPQEFCMPTFQCTFTPGTPQKYICEAFSWYKPDVSYNALQGYLAHKTPLSRRTLLWPYAWGLMVVPGGEVVSYERGNPVSAPQVGRRRCRSCRNSMRGAGGSTPFRPPRSPFGLRDCN